MNVVSESKLKTDAAKLKAQDPGKYAKVGEPKSKSKKPAEEVKEGEVKLGIAGHWMIGGANLKDKWNFANNVGDLRAYNHKSDLVYWPQYRLAGSEEEVRMLANKVGLDFDAALNSDEPSNWVYSVQNFERNPDIFQAFVNDYNDYKSRLGTAKTPQERQAIKEQEREVYTMDAAERLYNDLVFFEMGGVLQRVPVDASTGKEKEGPGKARSPRKTTQEAAAKNLFKYYKAAEAKNKYFDVSNLVPEGTGGETKDTLPAKTVYYRFPAGFVETYDIGRKAYFTRDVGAVNFIRLAGIGGKNEDVNNVNEILEAAKKRPYNLKQ